MPYSVIRGCSTLVLLLICLGAHAQSAKVVLVPMFGDDAAAKWRGSWVDDTDYKRGDLVEDFGSSYIARLNHLSEAGVNDPQSDADDGGELDFWDLVAVKGDNGDKGEQGDKGDKGDRGDTGLLDQAALDFMLDCIELGSVKRIVFVTRTPYNGYLVGHAGALDGSTYNDGLLAGDALCQSRADAAGLAGIYKAWLSSLSGSPSTRFVKSLGQYVRTDGVVVAEDWNDLTTPPLKAPISKTEFEQVSTSDPWTATTASGAPSLSHHCNGWASPSNYIWGYRGNTTRSDSGWSYEFIEMCDNTAPLYCFQQ